PGPVKQLLGGVNTLNGFSTTAPIGMTLSANIDPLTIDPTPMTPCTPDDCRIVMFPLDMNGMAQTNVIIPLIVHTTTTTAIAPASLAIIPAIPLLQNQQYVIAIKRGIKDTR